MSRQKILFVTALTILFACNNDDPAPTRTQLLCAKPWRLVETSINGVEEPADACNDDDQITFMESGEFSWDYGTVDCVSQPDQAPGSWQLLKNDTEIVWEYGHGLSRMEILELSPQVFRAALLGNSKGMVVQFAPAVN